MPAATWPSIGQWMLAWGPGVLILIGLFTLLMRPPRFIGDLIAAQQAQAVAMAKMASAVEAATAVRDARLEELLVNSQVILRREEDILARISEVRGAINVGRP